MKKQIPIFAILFLALRAITSFAQYTDIHDFDCFNEGCSPQAPGILAQGRDGNLYGSNGSRLFKITPGGTYHTLYTFNFGNFPERGGLTLGRDGYFYGTTVSGGIFDLGTIFKVNFAPSPPQFTVLHNFTGGADGANPVAPPIQGADGNFYGTTTGGQTRPAYKITPSGTFTALGSLPGLSIAPDPSDGRQFLWNDFRCWLLFRFGHGFQTHDWRQAHGHPPFQWNGRQHAPRRRSAG
jgi:uncharacterized repeat protein (TIGR03803 family)